MLISTIQIFFYYWQFYRLRLLLKLYLFTWFFRVWIDKQNIRVIYYYRLLIDYSFHSSPIWWNIMFVLRPAISPRDLLRTFPCLTALIVVFINLRKGFWLKFNRFFIFVVLWIIYQGRLIRFLIVTLSFWLLYFWNTYTMVNITIVYYGICYVILLKSNWVFILKNNLILFIAILIYHTL